MPILFIVGHAQGASPCTRPKPLHPATLEVGELRAVRLKGYSNGNTYVLDPYNAANNGWYPIDALWREQSTQYENIAALGHPLVKITDI